MLERAPSSPVEAPRCPELHRCREREEHDLQPHHRDEKLDAKHHREAAHKDERRQRRREEEIRLELAVLALVGILGRHLLFLAYDPVAGGLYGPLQVPLPSLPRKVLDRRLLCRQVDARMKHARDPREGLLDTPHARSAAHPRNAEGNPLHFRAVAGVLYGPYQLLRVGYGRVVRDGRLLGGETHTGLGDTFLLGEGPLDPAYARSTRHPRHRDSDQAVAPLGHGPNPSLPIKPLLPYPPIL